MVTLDATPKGTSSNSYTDRAYAENHLEEEGIYVAKWKAATDDDQDRALIQVTGILELAMDWFGSITTQEQALRLPRVGLNDLEGRIIDKDTVPVLAQNATARFAAYLFDSDRLKEPGILGQGLKEAKMGPMSVKVDSNPSSATKDLIPQFVLVMLSPIGKLRPAARYGSPVAQLTRM